MLISFLLCLSILAVTAVQTNDLCVKSATREPSGSRGTLTVGSDQTYTTITAAVAAASDGDTLLIHTGTYYENVVFDKALTIIGNGSGNTIINGGGTGYVATFSKDCRLFGVTVKNSGGGSTDSGIRTDNPYIVKVENCSITNNRYGYRGQGIGNFYNCTINSNWVGLYNPGIVETCSFLTNSDSAIVWMGMYYGLISNSTINNNGNDGIAMNTGQHSIIRNNHINNNNDQGIRIHGSTGNCEFLNNTFVNNRNEAINTQCGNNKFFGNTFKGNNGSFSPQVIDTSTNYWDNGSSGNYWEEWIKPDNNSDGYVDRPYYIGGPNGNKDNFPICPRISTPANLTAFEDVRFNQTCVIEQDVFTFPITYSTNASWLKIFGNAYFAGTPNNTHIGTYWVNATGSHYFNNFTITVLNVNDDPIINTTDNTTAFEDVYYYSKYTAYDIDPTNDVFSWDYASNASFLFWDVATEELEGMPTEDDIGKYWVNITLEDDKGGTAFTNYTLEVVNVNDPPVVYQTLQPISMDEDTSDSSLLLADAFIDIDSDWLNYTHGECANISIEILSDTSVTLTPLTNWSGKETLTFYANDTQYVVSNSVEVTVLPVNDAPINNNFTFEIWPADTNNVTFSSVMGTDSDSEVLYYFWDFGDGSDGEKTIALNITHSFPASNITTEHTVSLRVFDGAEYSEFCYNTVSIKAVNASTNETGNTTDDDIPDPDSDNDRLPDDWELENFESLDEDDEGDYDGDGYSNFQEYDRGWDPADPNSPGILDDDAVDDDDVVDDDTNGTEPDDDVQPDDDDIAGDNDSEGESIPKAAIIGIVIFIILILTAVVALVVILVRRRPPASDGIEQKDEDSAESEVEEEDSEE